MSVFKTLRNVGEGLYKEKGSKFLGFAFPCSSEEEAKNKLIDLRKEHHLAVHAILGQIQSFDLTNVLVAVVRYYGGTNLGVGGLINAYRKAAKEAIENAEIIEDEERIEIQISFSYDQLPQVMKLIKSQNCKILEQLIDQDCSLKMSLQVSNHLLLNQLNSIDSISIAYS